MSIDLAPVKEGKTAVIVCTIQNELHEPIDGSVLLYLRMTLFDQKTEGIINGRDKSDIYGVAPARVGGGMINTSGILDLRLDPADNPIIGTSKKPENHVVFLQWSWMDSGVQKYGGEELILPVENFVKLPGGEPTSLFASVSDSVKPT